MATLSSSWSVRHAAGEPFAVVRVSHLSGPVSAGQDAWGRPGKKQPVLVSAEVSFRHAFDTAAADDKLGIDTVHYGNLSKAILNSLDAYNPSVTVSASAAPRPSIKDATLRAVLEKIWSDLTGRRVDGSVSDDAHLRRPFLTLDRVRFLEVSVRLPKASLLGEAVSLTASSVFGEEDGGSPEKYGLKLALHNLRVPVLIGVNANERLSKQFVVTSATVDKFVAGADGGEVERRRKEMLDLYTGLEAHITKLLEASSYETLEALGAHLANSILAEYREHHGGHWQVHIRMEKPTAVPLAECPIVELRAGSDFPQSGKAT